MTPEEHHAVDLGLPRDSPATLQQCMAIWQYYSMQQALSTSNTDNLPDSVQNHTPSTLMTELMSAARGDKDLAPWAYVKADGACKSVAVVYFTVARQLRDPRQRHTKNLLPREICREVFEALAIALKKVPIQLFMLEKEQTSFAATNPCTSPQCALHLRWVECPAELLGPQDSYYLLDAHKGSMLSSD